MTGDVLCGTSRFSHTEDEKMTDGHRKNIRRPKRKPGTKVKKVILHRWLLLFAALICLIGGEIVIFNHVKNKKAKEASAQAGWEITSEKYIKDRPELFVNLLPVNPYSRPGTKLKQVKGIVVHYTANPGTTAMQNRDYFAGLEKSHKTSASSHFIIGLEGEIVQCVPCKEIAYASNDRNKDTISIECCIPDETGRFNESTYRSLVELTTWLMGRYDLGVEDVIRHYDVTGKNCPKYFVEHEEAWDDFHNDLADYIAENGIDKE